MDKLSGKLRTERTCPCFSSVARPRTGSTPAPETGYDSPMDTNHLWSVRGVAS